MSPRDLLQQPVWRGEELGAPMPDSTHAVSMALPRWQDVVGYEEKRPEVTTRLKNGYPRFVVHPLVQAAAARVCGTENCLPFPSAKVAGMALSFLECNRQKGVLVQAGDLFVVTTDAENMIALKAFWQHTGLIVSSRQAEAFLAGRANLPESPDILRSLRQQLAGFYEVGEDDVLLQPTGMAAQFAALRAVQAARPGLPTAQLGFPYVDTLKLQQKFGQGGHLLHQLDRVDQDLQDLLARQPLAACFCEIPGNPLLGSADLRRVTPVLRAHQVPLVADDVVATPFNVDLRGHADLIATSLTKYILGTGDAMGGAVICNPRSPHYPALKNILHAQHEDLLWGEEAAVLDAQARGFPERMLRHNANGLFIAEQLRRHPAIEKVWYPKWEFSEVYENVRRPSGGWGSLVTFLPKNAEQTSPGIYDRMPICKGPSLGTVFTLACPFTMLAHYTELEWAESCGVSRHLIRVSVGLEDPQETWRRIESALTP